MKQSILRIWKTIHDQIRSNRQWHHDITLTEFSGCETPARQIAFYNVPLVKEQSYTQNIPEAIQSETEEYSLITSGNKEVSADIDQSLINLRPIVPSPPETYTIIFNGNGGTASQTSMETGTDGTLDTLPTASRDGNYRFDGWFTDLPAVYRLQRVPSLPRKPQFMLTGLH